MLSLNVNEITPKLHLEQIDSDKEIIKNKFILDEINDKIDCYDSFGNTLQENSTEYSTCSNYDFDSDDECSNISSSSYAGNFKSI